MVEPLYPRGGLISAYFSSTFLAFLLGRLLPFDFLKILPRLVRASPLPMGCSSGCNDLISCKVRNYSAVSRLNS